MKTLIEINPALTLEDFGTEIIIVNLQNGAYFTLKDGACLLWRSLHDLPSLANAYDLDGTDQLHILQLLGQWQDDELLLLPEQVEALLTGVSDTSPGEKSAFPQPQYEKFTNMQDILLLDPIHDTGELGWPHRKP